MSRRIVVAVTGASGSIYGKRLVELLLTQADVEVLLMASDTGLRVAAHELRTPLRNVGDLAEQIAGNIGGPGSLRPVRNDFFAPVASGSFPVDAMVVAPCSGGRLGSFAAGVCDDLIDRAAEVTLKEQRKLVLVHRETPLSRIHLENMLKLQSAGAVILPANPGFYHHPTTVKDLVDYVIARVLDQLGIVSNIVARWGEQPADLATR
jgi:4-hydroxy-3-polyprenylbenzoate decarboxylase